MNYSDLLPIGSVVLLKEAEVKLMIIGRIVSDEEMKNIYDYVGVIYPTGLAAENDQYFFNRDAIDQIYHYGYIGEEEISFKEEVLSQLDELEIVDGKIQPKAEEDDEEEEEE